MADKDDILKWLDLQVDSPDWPKVVKPQENKFTPIELKIVDEEAKDI